MPVPDMTAIAAIVGSLNSAKEIAKSFVGLRDASMIQTKVIELQTAILSAQESAFSANTAQTTLLEQVRDLEKQIARLKTWDAEKKRYELKRWGAGAFAYVLKEDTDGGEPVHAICTTCYERGVKSVLQSNGEMQWMKHSWDCPNCKAHVKASRRSLSQPDAED